MSYEGVQLGHYRLLRPLGNHEAGRMYLAEDRRIQRQVVITIITPETTLLIPAETRAIALLDHPCILPVFDLNTENIHGTIFVYLVTPFYPEGSLHDWLQQSETTALLTLQDIEHILFQSADALQYAHDRGLVHQAVKPSNFLVRKRKEYPNRPDLMLTGFRIGNFSPATASANNSIDGTSAYIAPEQWTGQPVPATDQYALAALVYSLLVGHPPFQGTAPEERDHSYILEPQPPSMYNPHIPPALDKVILQALAKRPEDRFSSIQAFAEAFQRVLRTKNDYREATLPARRFEITQPITQISEPLSEPSLPLPAPLFTHTAKSLNSKGRGLPKKRMSLLIGLVILLLVGSSTFLFMSTAHQRALGNAASGINAVAKDVKATANTRANATATANTQTNATATGIASSYPFSNRVILNDPLSNNSEGYQWEQDSNDTGTCAFQQGTYHINLAKQGRFRECIAINTHFSNFTYEVRMTIVKGDCGGMIFRRSGSRFYYFRMCTDGSYYFIRYVTDADSSLNVTLKSGKDPAVNTGLDATNYLTVAAKGSQLDLYLNHHLIGRVIDTSYTVGQIGLVAKEETHPTEVVFTNAEIWKL